jgi:hypothetical protein
MAKVDSPQTRPEPLELPVLGIGKYSGDKKAHNSGFTSLPRVTKMMLKATN